MLQDVKEDDKLKSKDRDRPKILFVEVCKRESVRNYKGKDAQVDFIKFHVN